MYTCFEAKKKIDKVHYNARGTLLIICLIIWNFLFYLNIQRFEILSNPFFYVFKFLKC